MRISEMHAAMRTDEAYARARARLSEVGVNSAWLGFSRILAVAVDSMNTGQHVGRSRKVADHKQGTNPGSPFFSSPAEDSYKATALIGDRTTPG